MIGRSSAIMDNNGCKSVNTAVIVPTLCRYKHLKKCLDSLMKNPWARYVDLYIGLDYPAKESHWPGYREILKLTEKDYSIFHSFHVFKRTTNYGCIKNVNALFQEAIKEHDQFIYMEDDIEVSDNYLEYMLKALDYFRDDPDVISVTGYAYPVKIETENACSIITQNATCSTWGIGFWKNKYEVFRKDIEEDLCLIRNFSYNIRHCKFSRYRKADYINCVAGVDPDDKDVRKLCPLFTHVTDIAMGVYIQIKGKYQAMPAVSKVRNNGFDGTGVYCQTIEPSKSGKITSDTYDYSKQPLDQKKDFILSYDAGRSHSIAFRELDQFITPSTDMILKSKIKLMADRVFGKRKLGLQRIYYRVFKA